MLKRAAGFSLAEIFIISTIVIVVLIVGFILYEHDRSPQAIILNKQKTIDGYVKNLSPNNYTSFGQSLNVRRLITPTLYNATQSLISGYSNGTYLSDPFFSKYVCVEEVPSSFSYGPVTVNGLKAILDVNVFVPGSLQSVPYKTNWLDTASGWQLNSVSC